MIESPLPPRREKPESTTMESSSSSQPWRMVIVKFLAFVAVMATLTIFAVSISNSENFFFNLTPQLVTRGNADFKGETSPTLASSEAFDKVNHALAQRIPEEGPTNSVATVKSDGSLEAASLMDHKDDERTARMIRKYASAAHSSSNESDQTNNSDQKKVLNIHVVPHTHDDVGWLKTVDQLYYGWNDTIQVASVQEILTTVVQALEANPSRTFTYVEMKFFAMWWEEQPESVRKRVQKLVRETKQLSFTNGGWSMHDEASTHYIGMIDNTAFGHEFLKRTFDYVPLVGWQIDPFGHSSTQASLMTYKMGFDALYFGRIDYQDLELRHATKECEGLWNAFGEESRANDNGDEGSVFWGLTGSYEGNYGAPGGYCLDVKCGEWQKSFIDKNHTTLVAMVQDFLLAVREQSDRTKGTHVMLTMGSDFQFQRAAVNFANLDLLIETIMDLQEDGTTVIPDIFGPNYDAVNIFYSSPEYYTACKYNETVQHRSNINGSRKSASDESHNEKAPSSWNNLRTPRDLDSKIDTEIERRLSGFTTENKATENTSSPTSSIEWSIKTDDFFPYSDCSNCFWTGYFVSRPSLKRFERVASSFLLAARQIESTLYQESKGVEPVARAETNLGSENTCEDQLYQLDDAVGVLQHHDGVSGTSKQHVAYDYAKSVQAGINSLAPCTTRKLKRLLLGDKNGASEKYLKDLSYCQLLNETKCGISVDATVVSDDGEGGSTKDLYVVVYNSLASNRSAVIDLPVGSTGKYLVEDLEEGSAETLDALQMPLRSSNKETDGDSFVLSFTADSLPAVGAKVFRIQKHDASITEILKERRMDTSFDQMKNEFDEHEDDTVKISNGHFSVMVDTKTGNIRRIGSQEVEKLISWGYYTSFDSTKDAIRDDDNHNSGAYIFRPSTPFQELQIVPTKNASIVHTSIGTDIHTEFEEPWIQTTTRIRKGVPFVEIEYQIGPIPVNDGRGKEVVSRYNTGVNNNAVFYTDSNGREFIRRQRNHRPTWDMTVYEPVAGNYYPVNAAIYVDEKEGTSNGADLQEPGPSFAVVTDRTQGGGSIFDGTLELMVHRRTLVDDYRGVAEPINETDIGITPCPPYGNATRIGEGLVIRGKHRILVEKTECQDESDCGAVGGALLARSVMDASFADPLVFVGSSPSSEDVPFRTKSYSGLKEALPENVMLITKRLLYSEEATSYLIRLGHQYGDAVYVDLSILFPNQSIEEITEMTLSGNRNVDDWRKERFDWIPDSASRSTKQESSLNSGGGTTIELATLDIRTWIVKVK